jgi:hypothetical protein
MAARDLEQGAFTWEPGTKMAGRGRPPCEGRQPGPAPLQPTSNRVKQSELIEARSRAKALPADALWTSQDVADFLRVSLRWVEKQRALSALPCVSLPGRRLVRYDPVAIRAWALQHATDGRSGSR